MSVNSMKAGYVMGLCKLADIELEDREEIGTVTPFTFKDAGN